MISVIKQNLIPAGNRTGGIQFFLAGYPPLALKKSPATDQRTGRDVKGSLSLTANFVCPAQKTVQTLLDGHRAGKGRTVQEADLTVITVQRHLARSEERRVGKECRAGRAVDGAKKKKRV